MHCRAVEVDNSISFQEDRPANDIINSAFANTHEEEDIYPLTVSEIADAQKADKTLRKYFKRNKGKRKSAQDKSSRFQISLIEDVRVLTDENLKTSLPLREDGYPKTATEARDTMVSPLSTASGNKTS